MVSGLVTTPCDQLRIFSGDARLMRMASKSATGFAISNGLERNMFLRFPALSGSSQLPAASCQFLCFAATESLTPRNVLLNLQEFSFVVSGCDRPADFHWQLTTG